jgi:hypothetical protein
MIKMKSTGGIDAQDVPVFVCDEPITDVTNGAVVFPQPGREEDELLDATHAHKGACHDRAEAKISRPGGVPWQELADYLNRLALGLGVTVRDMINQEVGWSGAQPP